MIFPHEITRILEGHTDKNAIQHYELGGFHKNVSTRIQREFEAWYRVYKSEQPEQPEQPEQMQEAEPEKVESVEAEQLTLL